MDVNIPPHPVHCHLAVTPIAAPVALARGCSSELAALQADAAPKSISIRSGATTARDVRRTSPLDRFAAVASSLTSADHDGKRFNFFNSVDTGQNEAHLEFVRQSPGQSPGRFVWGSEGRGA